MVPSSYSKLTAYVYFVNLSSGCLYFCVRAGKTYQALEILKRAENGVYCGPLRLLALEVCLVASGAWLRLCYTNSNSALPWKGHLLGFSMGTADLCF